MKIKDEIKKLGKKYPNTTKIIVSYEGSGDSFGDFWNTEIEYELGDNDVKKLDFKDIEGLLWWAIEHSEANFNDSGSEGTVTIDLREYTLSLNNYFKVEETVPGGSGEWGEEEFVKPDY